MGRFYFNVRDGEKLTRDPQPHLFSTVEVARDSVIVTMRELLGEHEGDESLHEKRIEIADETGHPISVVDVDDVRSRQGRLRALEAILASPPELKI